MLAAVAVIARSTGAWAQLRRSRLKNTKLPSRGRKRITARRERCSLHPGGTTRAICVAEAKAAEKRAKADASWSTKNTDQARNDASLEYAEADYMVAKERCREQGGNARDICMEEARAAWAKAKADAKASATTGSVAKESSPNEETVQSGETPPAGERAAARAQCDQMSGNAREELFRRPNALAGCKSAVDELNHLRIRRAVSGSHPVLRDPLCTLVAWQAGRRVRAAVVLGARSCC
jgi:hypothetical protein